MVSIIAANNNEYNIFEYLDNNNTESAARIIYNTYYGDAERFFTSLGGNTNDFQELFPYSVLEFFERYYSKKYVKSNQAKLKTFLFSILKYQLYKKWKKDNKEFYSDEFPTEVSDELPDIGQLVSDDDGNLHKNRIIQECILKIGDKCKNVIEMYYYYSYSSKKIAILLGYESGRVVITTRSRCMKKLKECALNKMNN